jgi:squalene-hopene/tetraprenyl-beta-curcumene cyclase
MLAAVAASAAAPPPTAPSDPPRDKDVYRPPTAPLDARIAPERITEQDPPPLPQDILLPLPPDHRIAPRPEEAGIAAERWERATAAITRGAAYLRAQQDASGGWMVEAAAAPTDRPGAPAPVAIAVTALVVKALVQANGEEAAAEHVQNALRFIDLGRTPDGAYAGGDGMANYVTSAVVSALTAVDGFRSREAIRTAIVSLQQNQWDQTEGLEARQDWFGGAGYGRNGRPDLSNTQMMLDALYDAGLSPAEPAFQRALAFTTRTQNLRATNAAEWAGNDGGFVYTPANGGESMASEAAGEGRRGEKVAEGEPRSLRSYGSMTYAGFKSMLYAGLSPDDVRVRAAFDWMRRHFTFEENPGLGQQGLYYYYHTMARALRVAQQDVITDAVGVAHVWRDELIDAILARQRDDGSWRNAADRWLEAEPVLATAYALLAVEDAMKPVSRVTFERGADAPPAAGGPQR